MGVPAPQQSPVVSVRKLCTRFVTDRGIVEALEEVSFDVEAGETVALVGESGSGKSVTSLSMMRLLPAAGHIAAGNILFRHEDGVIVDMASTTEKVARRIRGAGIGMVFQEPMSSLNPALTIGLQIVEALRQHQGGSKAQASSRAEQLLEQVGITDPRRRLGSYPHQLSGGMRQRSAIAMAVACRPRLLIADEITTALDVTTQAQVLQMLRDLQAQTAMGVLFITHNLSLLPVIADRLIVMYAGQIIEAGPTDTVLTTPRHPYTRALLECLPARHPPRPEPTPWEPLPTIAGVAPELSTRPAGCAFRSRCPHAIARCEASRPGLTECDDGSHQARCWRLGEI